MLNLQCSPLSAHPAAFNPILFSTSSKEVYIEEQHRVELIGHELLAGKIIIVKGVFQDNNNDLSLYYICCLLQGPPDF